MALSMVDAVSFPILLEAMTGHRLAAEWPCMVRCQWSCDMRENAGVGIRMIKGRQLKAK